MQRRRSERTSTGELALIAALGAVNLGAIGYDVGPALVNAYLAALALTLGAILGMVARLSTSGPW